MQKLSLEDGIKLARELDDLDTKLMDIRDLFDFRSSVGKAGFKAVDELRKFRGKLVSELCKNYGMDSLKGRIGVWPMSMYER